MPSLNKNTLSRFRVQAHPGFGRYTGNRAAVTNVHMPLVKEAKWRVMTSQRTGPAPSRVKNAFLRQGIAEPNFEQRTEIT